MADDDKTQLVRELSTATAELRDGLRLWRESMGARLELDHATLELAKQRQALAHEYHAEVIENHRAYRRDLEDRSQRDKADHDLRIENQRVWRQDHERSRQGNPAQGRSTLKFLFCVIMAWFLLVSAYLVNWMSHHPNTIGH